MLVGKYECKLKRSGLIEVAYHPAFTLIDKWAIHKFFIGVAKRNKHKLPVGIEFIN